MNKKVYFINEWKCWEANYLYNRVKTYIRLNEGIIWENIYDSHFLIINTCNSSHRITKKNLNIIRRFQQKEIFIIWCWGDGGMNTVLQDIKVHIIPLGKEELLDDFFYKNRKINSVNSLDIQRDTLQNDVWTIEISRWSLYDRNYCGIGKIKQDTTSKPVDEIICEIESAIQAWAKEVVFSSDDLWSYGKDIGIDIFHLFEACKKLQGSIKIACNYIDPKFALTYRKQIISLFTDLQCISSILLPTYYNNHELVRLNMWYTVEEILSVIREIKPLWIYTHNHLTVFYPWETFEDFKTNIIDSELYDCITFNPYYHKSWENNYSNNFFNDTENNMKKLKFILYLVKKYPRRFNVEERIDRLISSPTIT